MPKVNKLMRFGISIVWIYLGGQKGHSASKIFKTFQERSERSEQSDFKSINVMFQINDIVLQF